MNADVHMKRHTSNIIAALYSKEGVIAAIALAAIGCHLTLRYGFHTTGTVFGFPSQEIPLLFALACGAPLVLGLVIKLTDEPTKEFIRQLLTNLVAWTRRLQQPQSS